MTSIDIKGITFEGSGQRESASTIKVGTRVKLLQKKYGDDYTTSPGIVVAIDLFQALPTVVIMYAEYSYASMPELKFAYFNEKTKDVELLRMSEEEATIAVKDDALEQFARAETDLLQKLQTLRERREFFLRKFAVAFSTLPRDLKTGAPAELVTA